MREFILLSLKGKTSPDFDLSNLVDEGRLDIVCQTISNSLFVANAIRRDTIMRVVLSGPSDPPKTVSFFGDKIRHMLSDERNIALVLKSALGKGLKLGEEMKVKEGIYVSKMSIERLIKDKKNLYYLNIDGGDIQQASFLDNPVFIFGDYIGLPRKTEKLLTRLGAIKICLGPKLLFASHCPVIVHNYLDRNSL